jgi:hypothetical protein
MSEAHRDDYPCCPHGSYRPLSGDIVYPNLTFGERHARAAFEAMDHERLVAQAVKWLGNAQEYARQRDAVRPVADAMIADAHRQLDRVKRLLSAKRKTVSMADLRAALYDPVDYGEAPPAPAAAERGREVVQVQGELL